MKNVLILNQAHTNNIGDIAIGESLSSWIKENGWNPITKPFWDEKSVFKMFGYTKFSTMIKMVPCLSDITIGKWVKTSIDSILVSNKIDCVIIGGGELFCAHKGFNIAFSCWVKEFVKNNIPVCVIGVSGDKNLSSVQIKRNKDALSCCFLVSVRDKDTAKVFKELYDVSADYAPDSVFRLNIRNNLKREADSLVCVPVRLNNKNSDYLDENSEVDYFYTQIKKVPEIKRILFTATEERDQLYIKRICENINRKYNTDYVYVPYKDLEAFCDLLDNAVCVLSGRMHAMILGLLKGCKPIPITFKRKLEVFDQEYCKDVEVDSVVKCVSEKYKEYAKLILINMK